MTDLREVECLTVDERADIRGVTTLWLRAEPADDFVRANLELLDTLDVSVAALRKAWRNYLNEMREYGTECGFCLQHGLTMQQATDLGIF